ncbi:MAG TPA: hypothetical protein VHG08_21375 [Longimicrobium sp.]|nr:hypothetical protein [Longimicrobium sp.]
MLRKKSAGGIRCVEVLMRQLESWAEQTEDLNGFLVHDLVEPAQAFVAAL